MLRCCDHFAVQGNITEILPKLHPKSAEYKRVYGDLIGTRYEGKSPDFRVNGKYYEFESFTGEPSKTKLTNMLRRGIKQSSRIIIDNPGVTDNYLCKVVSMRKSVGYLIDEVWIKSGSTIRKAY